MATARHPLPQGQLWKITITPQGQVQQPDYKVANGDSIEFYNTATYPVRITFTSIFSPITVNPGKTSSPITPPAGDINFTVNFNLANANGGAPTGGPYGIEFGTGPIEISISAANPTPPAVSIPLGGQIQFNSDAAYTISWGQPNIFSVTSIVPGLNPPDTAQVSNGSYSVPYNLVSKNPDAVQGRGTVKINS